MRRLVIGAILGVIAACAPPTPTPSPAPDATTGPTPSSATLASSTPSAARPSPAANLSNDEICQELQALLDLIYLGDCALDPITAGLRAGAEELARQLHERYGDRVQLGVGLFPYPPPADAQRACIAIRPVVAAHQPLAAKIVLADDRITGGSQYQGVVRLTNASLAPFELETSSNFSLYLFRPGEPDPIGISEGGSLGTGYGKTMAPSETIDFDGSGGTASCDLALGYVVPAGRYEVRALIDFKQDLDIPSLFFWSDAAAVEVIDP